jgi:EAL domain-containing protein (putative c-di-GMP-specific phosphodiesterase class I)
MNERTAENKRLRILVLDDDLFDLKERAQMLSDLGQSLVSTSQNGHEALAHMDRDSTPLDLILLDLGLRSMDALEFIRRLQLRRFEGRLILTSDEDDRVVRTVERLAAAHQIRVLGRLTRPVQKDRLAFFLRQWRPAARTFEVSQKKRYPAEAVREALKAGQFTVYYEPKVAIRTGELVGVEALARWHHPTDGLVFPNQFIEVAEGAGLIDDLTRLVFGTAMSQYAAFRAQGLAVRMAVNVSIDSLSSLDFADFAFAEAARAGIPPKDVSIEVTESRFMEDVRAPLEVLMRLHLMRFELSIDDFGTGYSSLSQLQDIPFAELKIDRTFVHRAHVDQTVRTMYRTSLGLARELGMKTVAEGVEDKADWDFVRGTECEVAQGYFIGRGMPPEALLSWFRTWQDRVRLGFPGEE